MDMLSKAIEMNGTKAIITNTNAYVVIKPIKDSYKDGSKLQIIYLPIPLSKMEI